MTKGGGAQGSVLASSSCSKLTTAGLLCDVVILTDDVKISRTIEKSDVQNQENATGRLSNWSKGG